MKIEKVKSKVIHWFHSHTVTATPTRTVGTHLTESPVPLTRSNWQTSAPNRNHTHPHRVTEVPVYQTPGPDLRSFVNRTRPRPRSTSARLHGPRRTTTDDAHRSVHEPWRTTGPLGFTNHRRLSLLQFSFSNRPPLISHHSLSPACRCCSVS